MSGAVAAHAAYNGSGTQGVAVLNNIAGTGASANDTIVSAFLNDNDVMRKYVYGSAFVEVPTTSGSGTSLANSIITQIFEVNNDIDCIGDMVLKVVVTSADSVAAGRTIETGPLDVVKLIDRVDILIGTSTWQTLTGDDLYALACTELPQGSFSDFTLQAGGGVGLDGEFAVDGLDEAEHKHGINGITAYIPLGTYTKTLGANLEHFVEQQEDGYLMAASTSYNVRVRVVTNGGVGTEFLTATTGSGNAAEIDNCGFGAAVNTATVNLQLFAKSQVMCNEERTLTLANTINKRVKTTQNINKDFTVTASAGTVTVDLDSFSLFASHLLISVIAGSSETSNDANDGKGTAELLLNSSSYSSQLPLGLLRMAGSSMGLYTNDLVHNNKKYGHRAVYVFPLAATAYGGSSVPLNRFDNIQLKLKNLPYASGKISVTCVGETTVIYQNNAASIAMY